MTTDLRKRTVVLLVIFFLTTVFTVHAQQVTFQRITSKSEKGNLFVSAEVDWPVDGSEAVLTSLRRYINENLHSWIAVTNEGASAYSGSIADGQAMADYYVRSATQSLQPDADEDMEIENDITIDAAGQNDRLVTLECSSYFRSGLGSGFPAEWGQAFSLTTGDKLTPVISEGLTYEMQPVLKKSFSASMEVPWDEAKEELELSDDIFPLTKHIYYVPGGVRFAYAIGELGPMILGLTTFDIADADLPAEVVKSTAAVPVAESSPKSDMVEITPEFTAAVKGYDYLGDFSEGMAVVGKGDLSGYINTNGELAIPCQYAGARPYSDGIAAVSQNHAYGYIDKEGHQVLPFNYFPYTDDEYDDAVNPSSCHEGLIANIQDGQWVYINKQGQTEISNTYGAVSAGRFSEGLAFLLLDADDNCFAVIDKTGKQVFSRNCNGEFFYGASSDELPYYHDGVIYVASIPDDAEYGDNGQTSEYYIAYDKQGNKIGHSWVKPQEASYERFEEDKKWGVKAPDGRVCVPAKYDFIDFPNEDDKLAASGVVVAEMFDTQNHKSYFGYVDLKGHDTFSAGVLALSAQSKQARQQQEEQREQHSSIANPSNNITAFNTNRDLRNYLKTPRGYQGSGPMSNATIELRPSEEGVDMYVNGCYLSALGLSRENENYLYSDHARFYVRENGASGRLYPVIIHLPDSQYPNGYLYFEPIETSVDRRILDAYNIPLSDIPNPDGWLWVEPDAQNGRGVFILHTDAKTKPRPIIYKLIK